LNNNSRSRHPPSPTRELVEIACDDSYSSPSTEEGGAPNPFANRPETTPNPQQLDTGFALNLELASDNTFPSATRLRMFFSPIQPFGNVSDSSDAPISIAVIASPSSRWRRFFYALICFTSAICQRVCGVRLTLATLLLVCLLFKNDDVLPRQDADCLFPLQRQFRPTDFSLDLRLRHLVD